MARDIPDAAKPARFDSWNRALRGAFKKGWNAYFDGKMKHECPYSDKRGHRGMVTWARSFIWAWQDGYNAAEEYSLTYPVNSG